MTSEVKSFTIDSVIKRYHIYKDVWFKCCTTVAMKEMKKGLSGWHPAAAKLIEMYTL